MKLDGITRGRQIEVGQFPASAILLCLGYHDADGLGAIFHLAADPKRARKVEVRRKDNQIAVFSHRYTDQDPPGDWKDAKVIWSLDIEPLMKEDSHENS